jgi:hypothetical protein
MPATQGFKYDEESQQPLTLNSLSREDVANMDERKLV